MNILYNVLVLFSLINLYHSRQIKPNKAAASELSGRINRPPLASDLEEVEEVEDDGDNDDNDDEDDDVDDVEVKDDDKEEVVVDDSVEFPEILVEKSEDVLSVALAVEPIPLPLTYALARSASPT